MTSAEKKLNKNQEELLGEMHVRICRKEDPAYPDDDILNVQSKMFIENISADELGKVFATLIIELTSNKSTDCVVELLASVLSSVYQHVLPDESPIEAITKLSQVLLYSKIAEEVMGNTSREKPEEKPKETKSEAKPKETKSEDDFAKVRARVKKALDELNSINSLLEQPNDNKKN